MVMFVLMLQVHVFLINWLKSLAVYHSVCSDADGDEDNDDDDDVCVSVFSERKLMFMFAICRRPSVCRLSVVCL